MSAIEFGNGGIVTKNEADAFMLALADIPDPMMPGQTAANHDREVRAAAAMVLESSRGPVQQVGNLSDGNADIRSTTGGER